MAVVFNLIRDAMLTDEELQKRRDAALLLEGATLALRMAAAFVVVSQCSSPPRALFGLSLTYSLWEGSVVLSNVHEIFTNAALELKVTLSKEALKAQLYKNAPVARCFFSRCH